MNPIIPINGLLMPDGRRQLPWLPARWLKKSTWFASHVEPVPGARSTQDITPALLVAAGRPWPPGCRWPPGVWARAQRLSSLASLYVQSVDRCDSIKLTGLFPVRQRRFHPPAASAHLGVGPSKPGPARSILRSHSGCSWKEHLKNHPLKTREESEPHLPSHLVRKWVHIWNVWRDPNLPSLGQESNRLQIRIQVSLLKFMTILDYRIISSYTKVFFR
jgi:hypothetical protein